MKQLPVFLILFAAISVIAGCDIFGSKDPPKIQNSGLKGFGITGLYVNGDRIIAGTRSIGSSSYIFLSRDNGTSWQQVGSISVNNTNPYNSAIAITHTSFGSNGKAIFAGIGGGYKGEVLVSTDNGKTWTEPDPDFTENVNCFTMINGILFADAGHGVFMTTDNGSSWAGADTAGLSYPVVGLAAVKGNLFAATFGEGIYRSTDKGASWTKVNATNFNFTSLATVGTDLFAGASKFYGKDSTGGVFISTNKGESWSHADAGITKNVVNALYWNGSKLFASSNGTNSGVYIYDGTSRWSLLSNTALLHSRIILSLAANNTYLFIGTANGVKRYPLFPIQ